MNIPTEKQASSLKKYFVEYTVLFLVVCVSLLFGLYYNLNEFITKTMLENNVKMQSVIEKNTNELYIFNHLNNSK